MLQLYCQAQGCWHPTRLDGRYTIEDPAEWFKALSPILRRLIPVLKFAVPLVGPWMSWIDPKLYEQQFKADIELMDALAGSLGDLKPDRVDAELAEAVGEARDPERAEGSALRALRKLLDEKDPQQHWGGLKKVLTPEGHYLWLCEHHARAYAR